MTPERARAWITGLDIFGMRFGIERMARLLAALGHPQRHAPALHVVGTNGKSSTTRFAAAALAAGGRRVGAYLSPHIVDWSERIQVGGRPVSEASFAEAVGAVREAVASLDLPPDDVITQFEALTASAFWAFRRAGVDAMAVEAGLGGRYDASNVLQPGAAVVLTNISLDHTALLGDTEAQIADEKLAVCPDGHRRLVVGPVSGAAADAVASVCGRRGLMPVRYGEGLEVVDRGDRFDVITPAGRYAGLRAAMPGTFQRENLAVALAGAEMVAGGPLDAGRVGPAVASVRLPGRAEWIDGSPPVLLDGAHNPAGVDALVATLPELVGERRPRVGVVSVLDDKDARAMLARLVPHLDRVILTGSHHQRAVDAERLAGVARELGAEATAVAAPREALGRAREAAGPSGVVVVAGSLYLLGDLRAQALGETGVS